MSSSPQYTTHAHIYLRLSDMALACDIHDTGRQSSVSACPATPVSLCVRVIGSDPLSESLSRVCDADSQVQSGDGAGRETGERDADLKDALAASGAAVILMSDRQLKGRIPGIRDRSSWSTSTTVAKCTTVICLRCH